MLGAWTLVCATHSKANVGAPELRKGARGPDIYCAGSWELSQDLKVEVVRMQI